MKKESIEFDTFGQVEMRIGTVRSAEVVPDADKLLKLMVDFGEEELRQIVSGIRERVSAPEELVERQFVFVTNIPPRTIRGYESNGMILAAGEGEEFTFIAPEKEVSPGTELR